MIQRAGRRPVFPAIDRYPQEAHGYPTQVEQTATRLAGLGPRARAGTGRGSTRAARASPPPPWTARSPGGASRSIRLARPLTEGVSGRQEEVDRPLVAAHRHAAAADLPGTGGPSPLAPTMTTNRTSRRSRADCGEDTHSLRLRRQFEGRSSCPEGRSRPRLRPASTCRRAEAFERARPDGSP